MKVAIYTGCTDGFALTQEACHWMLQNGLTGHLKERIEKWLRCISKLGVRNPEEFEFHNVDYEERTNPTLVACIETLGDAAGDDLDAVEVDGDRYLIEVDHKGREHVVTPMTIQWINNKYREDNHE